MLLDGNVAIAIAVAAAANRVGVAGRSLGRTWHLRPWCVVEIGHGSVNLAKATPCWLL